MDYLLYRLTFSNGKSYIGQTVRGMNIRLAQHRTATNRGSSLAVHCAWRKYGEPSVSIIGEYDSADALHAAEIAAIQNYGTLSPMGYNVGLGGETAASKSPTVAAKISEKAKGRKIDNTPRRQEIARELWQSDDYREAQSLSQKASWSDREDRRALASARTKAMWVKRKADGWVMPESTKAKLAKKAVSEETRAKMSAAAKRRGAPKLSAEARAKLSQRAKEAWQNPELTERRVASIKAAYARKVAGECYSPFTPPQEDKTDAA